MSTTQGLDPWLDAEQLARRLRAPGSELLVVLGAESWCGKCQRLRPAFEQLSAQLPAHVAPLWLDLEDHAEFLNGFIPPDLPLLLRWREGRCVQAAVLQDIALDAADPSQRVRLDPLPLQGDQLADSDGALQHLPPLWREFSEADWAQN